jgi:glycosyltransferase involved in cell wall biosynthesis
MKVRHKSVGIFSLTNDSPSLETGVTTYNQDLIRKLCQRFPEMVFIVYLSKKNSERFSNIKYENLKKVILHKILLYKKAGVINKVNSVLTAYFPWLKSFKEFEYFRTAEKHDLYIYTVFGIFQWFPYFIRTRLKIQCISVIHDIRFLKKIRKSLESKLSFLYEKHLFKKICDSSEAILLPSLDAIKIISEKLPVEKKCYKSFSVPVTLGLPVQLGGGIPRIVSEPYFFFPATIVDTKNHMFLVEVFHLYHARFPKVKLIFCGSNTDSCLWARISDKVSELDLADSVIHMGFVLEEVKKQLFRNAIAAIFPTEKESFNMGIWEAFDQKCPVLVSDDVELLEQVGDAALVSRARKKESLLAQMILLSTNPDLRADLSRKGTSRLNHCIENSLLSGWERIISKI